MSKDQENSNRGGCILFLILAMIFITVFWAIPGGIDSVATGGSFWEGAKGIVGINIFVIIVGVIIYMIIKDTSN